VSVVLVPDHNFTSLFGREPRPPALSASLAAGPSLDPASPPTGDPDDHCTKRRSTFSPPGWGPATTAG